MKKLLLAALIVALALAVFLLQGGGRREQGAAIHGAEPAKGASAAEVGSVLVPAPAEPDRAPIAPSGDAVRKLAPTPPHAEPKPSVGLSLSGTLIVLDEQGVEHPSEDGSFTLYAFDDAGEGTQVDVEVRAGIWTAVFAGLAVVGDAVELGFYQVELGGRPAALDGGPHLHVSLKGERLLELRARWLTAIVVHVQDRETGRELPAVELVEVEVGFERNAEHPGVATWRPLAGGDSPVEIAPREEFTWQRVIHARSPGYGWGRIEIDPNRPEDRFLLLEPDGDLGVTLTGDTREPVAVLRLRRRGTSESGVRPAAWSPRPVFEALVGGRTSFEIGSLTSGVYQVRVETGNTWRDPRVLGEAEVEVVAGLRAEVVLTLEAPEPVARVPLEGTLVLPVEWELGTPSLGFELLDPLVGEQETYFSVDGASMSAIEDAPDTFRWSAGEVQPGRYAIGLDDPPFGISLEVGPAGERDARVVVPPPCRVYVRCVDDETESDVALDALHWCSKRPRSGGGGLAQAEWDESLARWTFRAPLGEIELSTWDQRYEHVEMGAEIGPGANELVLRLRPATGLFLVLRDGDVEVGWSDEWEAELAPTSGSRYGTSWSWVDGRLLLRVKDTGSYRLKIGEIPGYEPVPEETLELERGTVREHVIELRRRR